MNKDLPSTVYSKRVPTEYDIERTPVLGLVVLSDDRGRRFSGFSLTGAFRRAEKAQDPADPIHHPPYPDPREVPLA